MGNGCLWLVPGSHEQGQCEVLYTKADKEAGHAVERELTVLLVHGVLHLLGHDHEEPDDEAVMKLAVEHSARGWSNALQCASA